LKQWINNKKPKEFVKLRAYLWGIETGKMEKFEYGDVAVASLPMRNWNSFLLNRKGSRWRRCEPTYEELKPKLLCCPDMVIFVASLPMRNWNTFSEYSYIASRKRCEPTYEELKQFWQSCKNYFIVSCEPTYEELKLIFANFSKILFCSTLRAYLWGIETPFRICLLSPAALCCEPTYEELKPLLFLYICCVAQCCEPTYEELKLCNL